MLKKIKDFFHAALKKSGTAFYTKPQTYEVSYQVAAKNIGKRAETVTIVLPAPQNTQDQLVSQGKNSAQKKIEQLYKNAYDLWNVRLEPGEEQTIKQNYIVTITPEKIKEVQKKYRLEEYSTASKLYKLYTRKSFHISPDNKTIQGITKKLIGDEKNIFTIVSKINEYVIKSLTYGNPTLGLYSAHDALKKDCVDCGGFSTFFVSMCISVGIPARVVAGFWAGYPEKNIKHAMHAWAEVLLPDGSWILADPSTEKLNRENRTRLFGKLGSRTTDRIIFSLGSDFEIQKEKIPILQNPIVLPKGTSVQATLAYTAKKHT